MIFKNKTASQPVKAEGLLPLNLQHFSEPPTEPPAGDPPAEPPSQGGGEPNPTTEPPSEHEKTFTQDDVDNLIKRESSKQQEKLLKQLGIDDFDSAKEGMKKFQEWQDAQKTEQEKQAEKLQQLESDYSSTNEENTILKAQISAMKAGVIAESVEDVVVLAKTLVTDDVDMDAAIKQVVDKYPQFAQQEQETEEKPNFSNGTHKKQPTTEVDKWLNAFK